MINDMKKSFTLIELLIVIAIIAIIAVGIIILIIPGERLAQARDATRAAHLKNLETALYLYDLDHGLITLGITENLTEICNTELENYDCTGLVDLSSLNITIPTDPLGGNSPNGTGYYLALINNKAVLYATKAEIKETKIGIAEGVIFIYTWHDLHDIRDNLGDHYILMNNLNSATVGYDDYNTGDGWLPIGTLANRFEGIFDGNGKTISNLIINRAGTNYIGLFGYTDTDSSIKNLGLVNGNVIGGNYIAGLVGHNSGLIINSYNNNIIIGVDYIGGIAGRNEGSIINSYNNNNLSGEDYIGGITGRNYNNGSIIKSHNNGNILGEWNIGGVAGRNESLVDESYNTGSVEGLGPVGGVVGQNWEIVINSYNTGSVTGDWDTGGLVGYNSEGLITNSYNNGIIIGEQYVGGLIGYNTGPITNSYNTGSVTGDSSFGGLTGDNTSSITNSYFSAGFNNGYGTEEVDETNFYFQTHDVYDQEGIDPWTSPPWFWLANDFPKLNI